MGCIDCPIHGQTGADPVCPHIEDAIDQMKRIDLFEDEDEFVGLLCETCKKYVESISISPDETDEFVCQKYDDQISRLNINLVCGKCLCIWADSLGISIPSDLRREP